jgi:hypothetical protein
MNRSHAFPNRFGKFWTAALVVVFGIAVQSGAAPLDGIWQSQGYGYVFEFQGSALHAFEVTETTCVRSFSAKEAREVNGRDATFRGPDGLVLSIDSGITPDHRLLHIEGSASRIRIDRLSRKPEVCDRLTPNTPLGNFEVFAQTWSEHYISFELKHADWSKVVAENRAKITPTTTPSQLFDILKSMIVSFGDAHAGIVAPDVKKQYAGLRSGTGQLFQDMGGRDEFMKSGLTKLLDVTKRAYLNGPVRNYCNGKIQYGHVDSATGYLRIVAFDDYARGGFEKGQEALDAALDEIFSDSNLRRLVIDVRYNSGGADPYGLAIASRLATSEYLAYTKYARASREPGTWTPADPSIVKPSSRPGFHGPVVLLTGPLTISAGETFTQALMGRTPHVTRIGENTQGVYSDVLLRALPNGWLFGLPNEIYRTSSGETFDGPGISPDRNVPVFTAADIAEGRDPAMAAALEVLSSSPQVR